MFNGDCRRKLEFPSKPNAYALRPPIGRIGHPAVLTSFRWYIRSRVGRLPKTLRTRLASRKSSNAITASYSVTLCRQPGSSIATPSRAKLFHEEPEAGSVRGRGVGRERYIGTRTGHCDDRHAIGRPERQQKPGQARSTRRVASGAQMRHDAYCIAAWLSARWPAWQACHVPETRPDTG